MLSNKMTVSLMSLITLIALGFIVVSPATAAVLGEDFTTTIMLPDTAGTVVQETSDGTLMIKVVFGKPVTVVDNTSKDLTTDPPTGVGRFAAEDIMITAYDKTSGDPIATAAGVTDFTASTIPVTTVDVTLTGLSFDDATNPAGLFVTLSIAAGVARNADTADVFKANTSEDTLGVNAKASLNFEVVPVVTGRPMVVDIERPGAAIGQDTFPITILLSMKPKEFKKDHIEVTNATVEGEPVALTTKMVEVVTRPGGTFTSTLTMVYPYLVTIKPKYEAKIDGNKADIVIKIKPFENTDFISKASLVSTAYRVKVTTDKNRKVLLSGAKKALAEKIVIPANGFLVVAKNPKESYVINPGNAEHGEDDRARRDREVKESYNLVGLDLGVDLQGFFIRGGTIDLVSPKAGLVISEIMWGTDAGSRDRQWIEIVNTTTEDIKLEKDANATYFMVYESNELLPNMAADATIRDRVSTLYKGTNHWSIAGKGQSGRTLGKITETLQNVAGSENVAVDVEIVPTSALVSMERAMAADGTYADGTMADSWGQSMLPSQNFVDAAGGLFVGSPGASPINPVADPAPVADPVAASVADAMDIMITEIMVDTGDGRFPQWIELTNVSGAEKSLAGWSLRITNDATDDGVIGATVNINLSGTLGVGGGEDAGGTMGKSLLLVGGTARSSSNLAGSDRVVDISSQVDQRGRYAFISSIGFMAALIPPQKTGVLTYGNTAGNLEGGWDLPMSEDSRSSLIRREMLADGMATMGTDANGWILASSTSLAEGPATWYGSDEDNGTPGHDAGGPLPVELSHFRPARDKATGAVVITWATQSELNNAGFFIKRSNQRNGEFKVINATMVAGAGTTSEKQFYTYTDTTAQPNVVYYYQIEDVSLDGNRQTLTNGIRLKGHIGAAGKATTTWGDLKTSHE